VIAELQGCMLVALQCCVIVALQGCVIVVLQGCVIVLAAKNQRSPKLISMILYQFLGIFD
jgi:hypothetical protein